MFMLIAHVCIALSSVLFSTVLYFFPSKAKYNISSWLLISTLATGTILVVAHPGHLVSSCISGLAYLAFVTSLMYMSSRKLATYSVRKKQ